MTSSSELDTIHDGAVLSDPSDRALARLLSQAKSMQAANQIGQALSRTAVVPEMYQRWPANKPENETAGDNATAAILYGAELGFSAVQSLQNVFVVKGKPAIYARTMVAQVIAAGHMMWEIETSAASISWKGRRADNGTEFTSTWTMDRAKTAGYTSNTLYQKSPIEMLRAKSQAEVARTLFPDVLLGIAYSKEDLDLDDNPRRVDSTPQSNTVEDLRAQLAGSKSTSEPTAQDDAPAAPDAEVPAEQPPAESDEQATPETDVDAAPPKAVTNRKMHALFRDAGLGDNRRTERLTVVSKIISRPISTGNEMSEAEAVHVINTLQELKDTDVLRDSIEGLLAEAATTTPQED